MDKLALKGGTPVRTAGWPAWPQHDSTEREGLVRVLDSAHWWSTEGNEVRAFEAEWAGFCGVPHCMAVTNGTHAIEVALLAAGIGAGDEVIVPDYTFFATAAAAATVNAIPVPVDIDPDTFCIDPAAAERAIGPRTRAIVAVHLAGHPADLDRLGELCARHDLALIEDCAHAHGSSWRGIPVGGHGTAGTFSFQQSKLLTAGEGGAIVARDAAVAGRIRSFADCGRLPGEWFYSHYALGGNFRLSEWQAAVLRAQLARFPEQNRQRNAHALFLNAELARIPGVRPQWRDPRATSQGYYCYVVAIDEAAFGASRDQVHAALVAEGMPLTVSYPPIHRIAAFTRPDGLAPRHRDPTHWPDYRALDLPHSRAAAATTLWFRHALLMGSRADAATLVEALAKVQRHAGELRS
jgi:dTDP-4-amino-4,6-dideoxygalactose transaminase